MKELSQKHGLPYFVLPDHMMMWHDGDEFEGKDIAEYFEQGKFNLDMYKNHLDDLLDNNLMRPGLVEQSEITQPQYSEPLKTILESECELRKRTMEQISFVKPIIKHNDYDLFYPNALNVIQGKMGAHKSRFVGDIASLLLKDDGNSTLSGMKLGPVKLTPVVCYIDTERNKMDQLPFACMSSNKVNFRDNKVSYIINT